MIKKITIELVDGQIPKYSFEGNVTIRDFIRIKVTMQRAFRTFVSELHKTHKKTEINNERGRSISAGTGTGTGTEQRIEQPKAEPVKPKRGNKPITEQTF